MQNTVNKPIFIVGSPRSGTSVLSWCLDRHPNIFNVNESTGIGDLALAVANCYQRKMGLGTDSLWTAMSVGRDEFFAAFGRTVDELILSHKVDLEKRRWEQTFAPNTPPHRFPAERAASLAKMRWVDGTPLYSFYIYGLRKLFPNALFIHIVRDVASVVRSILNFHRLSGGNVVANEQEAYELWFRSVSACVLAEQAYGAKVVFRLRYAQLADQPEAAMRDLLNFLGEPYTAQCLTPLQKKINSSNVPLDFQLGDPKNDPAIIQRALLLNAEVQQASQASELSPAAGAKMEAAFYEEAHRKSQQLGKVQARAKRLAREIKRKRAFIQELLAWRRRHKLLRLLFSYKSTALFSCTAYFADVIDCLDCLSATI